MPLEFNFTSQNFLITPKGKDKYFRIRDKNNKHKYSIIPKQSYFYYKNRYVYIRQDGSNNITLDFKTEQEAIIALKKLNDMKSFFLKTESDVREYYTKSELDNGQLDSFYVNKDGDTMTGDLEISSGGLQIITLSATDGTQSININELGKLIKGNQYLFKENIDTNKYVDIFSKNLDDEFSVFWEYSVKSGSNIRAGSIIAAWDSDTNQVSFTHVSTMDIGDTTDIDFKVDMDGSNKNIRLFAQITNGTWLVKILRRFV